MSAGSLRASIALHNADGIHYGSASVTGDVLLTFWPILASEQKKLEFFGPLKVTLTFHGRAKSKVRVRTNNSSHTYRGRVPLFSKSITIFEDSARIAAGERWPIPFELAFPDGFECRIAGEWEQDSRFEISQEQPLPPSFRNDYSGFANQYESFVEYRIGLSIHTPHVPVNIQKPEKYSETLVHYQQPRPPRPPELKNVQRKGQIDISNEFLLPEEDRPTGFRQKAKAALYSDFYPHYHFNWTLIAPQHIYVGQPIAFEVSIREVANRNTAVVIPEVKLAGFVATLMGCTTVRAEKQFFSSPEASHVDDLKRLRGILDDARPFSNAHHWSKTINTPAIPEGVTTSFRTVNISYTHTMKVHFYFEAANKTFQIEQQFTVILLPSLMNTASANGDASSSGAVATSSSGAVAGIISEPLNMRQIDEALPRYDEGLPKYREAIDSKPTSPTKGADATGSSLPN